MLGFLLSGLVLVGCGGGNEQESAADQASPAVSGGQARIEATRVFSDLEPAKGDVLVLPKIGFRWAADSTTVVRLTAPPPGASGPETTLTAAGTPSEPPWLFQVTVTDSAGAVYGKSTATRNEAWLELPPTTDPGTYFWQVELLSGPDRSVRAQSEVASFLLQ